MSFVSVNTSVFTYDDNESKTKIKEAKPSNVSSLDTTLASVYSHKKKAVSFGKVDFVKIQSYKKFNKIYKQSKSVIESDDGLFGCQCKIF